MHVHNEQPTGGAGPDRSAEAARAGCGRTAMAHRTTPPHAPHGPRHRHTAMPPPHADTTARTTATTQDQPRCLRQVAPRPHVVQSSWPTLGPHHTWTRSEPSYATLVRGSSISISSSHQQQAGAVTVPWGGPRYPADGSASGSAMQTLPSGSAMQTAPRAC